jgi:hypothetical protein
VSVISVLTLLSADAKACSCTGGGSSLIVTLPAGEVDLPRNTGAWILSDSDDDGFDRSFTLQTVPPGLAVPVVDMSRVLAGRGSAWFGFEDPPPAGTEIQFVLTSDGYVLDSWVTGDLVDDTPPTWGGDYTVETSRSDVRGSSCGASEFQEYNLLGVSDDFSSDAEIGIHLESTGVGRDLYGWGDQAPAIRQTEGCPRATDDPTVRDHWRREYEVELFDLAGNVTLGGVVKTSGGGCSGGGCATSEGSGVGWWVLAALAVRRRSAPHSALAGGW